jgi:DNA-binding HxlR family transcriptional regulator
VAEQEQVCARFHRAVELVGRRWTGAIIRVLLHGPARYHELASAIPDISDRMLAERLRELESEELIVRTVIPETPVRVEYALTRKGRELQPALDALGRWADRYVALPGDPARRASRAPRSG